MYFDQSLPPVIIQAYWPHPWDLGLLRYIHARFPPVSTDLGNNGASQRKASGNLFCLPLDCSLAFGSPVPLLPSLHITIQTVKCDVITYNFGGNELPQIHSLV